MKNAMMLALSIVMAALIGFNTEFMCEKVSDARAVNGNKSEDINEEYAHCDVYFKNNVSDEQRETFANELANEPVEVMNMLFADGLIFEVSADKKTVGEWYSGLYLNKTKHIALDSTEGNYFASIHHEIGHAVDDYIGHTTIGEGAYLSDSETFQRIYQKEAEYSGLGGYETSDTCEYFASAYEAVIHNRPITSNMPLTTAFIKENVERTFGTKIQ